jgi:hypothetical protein
MKFIVYIASIAFIFLIYGCYSVGTTTRDVDVHVPTIKDTTHLVSRKDTTNVVAVGKKDSSKVTLIINTPVQPPITPNQSNDEIIQQRDTWKKKCEKVEADKKELQRIIDENDVDAIVEVHPPDVKTLEITKTVTPGKLLMLWQLKGYILSLMFLAVLLNWLIYLFLKLKGIALNPTGLIKRIIG